MDRMDGGTLNACLRPLQRRVGGGMMISSNTSWLPLNFIITIICCCQCSGGAWTI